MNAILEVMNTIFSAASLPFLPLRVFMLLLLPLQ